MRITSVCNICGAALKSVVHALVECPHARRLWEEMRSTWCLPSVDYLAKPLRHWFQSVLAQLPDHLIDNTLLVACRAWYTRNEVTHDKPLPSLEGSKRFLCSYLQLIRNSTGISTYTVIKGKAHMYVWYYICSYFGKKGMINPGRRPPPAGSSSQLTIHFWRQIILSI
jgi:hypothetical protein